MQKKYIYDKDIILKLIRDNQKYYSLISLDGAERITKETAKRIYEHLKDQLYLIAPNPTDNRIVFLVYETENINLFCEYNNTLKVQKNLKNQYKKMYDGFKYIINYDYFINHLDYFKELKITSRNILLKDGYIYNYDDLVFEKESYEIPSYYSDLELKQESPKDTEILDKCFRMMYNTDETMKQFLYYIYCNLNKSNAIQTIFLVFDKSGVGKTSKILPMVELGLNNILDSRLLEKSELYNIAYKNSVIYNETQTEKNINGSSLSNLADNAPLTVTRKSDNALTIPKDEKPLLQLMGEALPFIKGLNNGTDRRFLLVPKVSNEYIEYIEHGNKQLLTNFYYILNNKPIEVIQYYIKKINEYNIINLKDRIKETMFISLKELSELTENKEAIFEEYFNLNPMGKYEECNETRYLIESSESLNHFLEYIDNNIITVSHFNDKNLRRNYLISLIRENTGKRLKDLGSHNIKGHNYFYYYCLTEKGVNLLEKINDKKIYEDKLLYHCVTN